MKGIKWESQRFTGESAQRALPALLTLLFTVTASHVEGSSRVPAPEVDRAVRLASPAVACPADGKVLADFQLAVGQSVFWDGEYVDTTTGDGCTECEWRIDAADGADRLRVALDLVLDYRRDADGSIRAEDEGVHPDAAAGRNLKLEIFEGAVAAGDPLFTRTMEVYSLELFLCFNRPAGEPCIPFTFENGMPCGLNDDGTPRYTCEAFAGFAKTLPRSSCGIWTVKVSPDGDVFGWRFRMRAKLEPPTMPSYEPRLPNLRTIPPFELTFCEPKVSFGFFVAHTPVCGAESNGLTDQEEADLIAAEAATGSIKSFHRGLRFSVGPENAGDGFLELRTHIDDLRNTPIQKFAFQRFYYADGTAVPGDVEVGTLEFHEAHAHWHYEFFTYELFELTRTHPTKPWKKIRVGQRTAGTKAGFCPSDDQLADWNLFYQLSNGRWTDDRVEEDFEGGISCESPDRPMMGLTPGWGDLYEWPRVEQFVEFPMNAAGSPKDGYYLLRATVGGKLVESNYKDNTSYAFFKVTNGAIELIKRGYSAEP